MTHVDNELLETLATLHAAEFEAATTMLAAGGGTPILTAAQDAADNAVDHVLAAAVRVGATTAHARVTELETAVEASESLRDTLREDRDAYAAAFERLVPLDVRECDGTVAGMEEWLREHVTTPPTRPV